MKRDATESEGHQHVAAPWQASDGRWREAFEHNPAMYCMVDAAGLVLAANSVAASRLGFAVDELVGRSVLNLVSAGDKELVRAKLAACLEAPGEAKSWQIRKIRKDGTVRWCRESAKAVRWSGDQVIVLISGEDVTERHLDELESSHLAAIVSSSDDAIISKTLNGIVTSWNAGATAIFGYEAQEMIGQSITRIIPPELHDEEMAILAQLQRGEWIKHYETTRVAKDGRRVAISLTVSPLFDKSGRVVGASKVARDISEAKLAEQARRAGASRMQALIETAVDGVILIDAHGGVLIFNPACEKLFGYSAAEVVGKNVKMLMPEPYRHEHDRYIADYRATRIPKIIGIGREVAGRRKDGSTFPMLLSVGETEKEEGEPIFVGIIHDLTSRKRTEAELEQARADLVRVARITTLGELTAAIAHEVNQPLTGLVNGGNACLRWLAGEPPDLEAARQSVERMIKAGNRAAEVIARIRALVAKSPQRQEPLNISDTIGEVIALIGAEVERNRISLTTLLADDLPIVLGDRVQLQQVILNLMLNAVEALNGVGEEQRGLSVTAMKDGSTGVLVAVRDTGPGVDEASLDRLFEAFYTTKPQGMGMGLAVSRTIIQAHGGRLWATPNVPRGATFQFTLPNDDERSA